MKTIQSIASVATGLLLGGGLLAESSVDAVQRCAGEWAKVRAETIRLETDWEVQRVLLGSTREALEARVRQLEEKRAEVEARTTGERRELATLLERQQSMATEVRKTGEQLEDLDAQLMRLRVWLPPRLSQALELPYRSLAAPGLPAGDRMQHTTAILRRCQHFNRTIAVAEEPLALDGGEARLLEVVYWGLSHGYALDRTRGLAYVGGPGPKGWTWRAASELAPAIGQLIAVCRDKAQPEFVGLPLRLAGPANLDPQP